MTDLATLLDALAGLVTPLFWPTVALIALLLFRKEIRSLFGRIRRGVILGQEIELEESLSRLDQSAVEAASEVAALPQREYAESGLQRPEDVDVVRRVLNEAARSPKTALLLLASEIERELRELLASLGLLRGRQYVPFREAIQILQQHSGLPEHVTSSIELFWNVRNRLVHGHGATDDDLIRAIDSGTTILKALQAIPRETNVVYHPGVDVYADSLGQQVREGVKGVILETESPGGATKTRHILATTRTHFQRGKRVAWEWSDEHRFGESWYRDPDTQEMRHAWTDSLEFVGRHLEDL